MKNLFDLTDKVALITGGGGLLGPKHGEAIVEYGGKVILADWHEDKAMVNANKINEKYGKEVATWEYIDVTNKESIQSVVDKYEKIDIQVNGAGLTKAGIEDSGLDFFANFEKTNQELWDLGLKVNISGVKEGLLRIFGRDSKGRMIPENQTIIRNGKPLSSNSDDWHFAIIYNIMVDRFRDGDSLNNKPIHDPKLHELANFMGGDFAGIQQKLDEGYFKDLGVNTLWISPIQKQPDSSWVEWVPPNRTFSGYHGYWPIEPRKIDPRFGKSEEFHSIVKAAHQTGTKVILDFS